MKQFLLLAPMLLIVMLGFVVNIEKADAKKSAPKKEKIQSANSARLGTSFRFDGASLHGKFQTAPSTTATVENDKVLEDLLGARKSFRDRIAKDSERD
ncbi:MAG: hypothetical protein AB7O96_12385 [Pseudobdellovibrionaceae bacterium]